MTQKPGSDDTNSSSRNIGRVSRLEYTGRRHTATTATATFGVLCDGLERVLLQNSQRKVRLPTVTTENPLTIQAPVGGICWVCCVLRRALSTPSGPLCKSPTCSHILKTALPYLAVQMSHSRCGGNCSASMPWLCFYSYTSVWASDLYSEQPF
jgi:hypothetical protein